jgi:hypothetical protein
MAMSASAALAAVGPTLSAAPVVQAPTVSADTPPSPEAVARARTRADALIAAGHAEAYFDDITDSAEPRVRHKASGLECVFTLDGEAAIAVDPAGRNASCTSTSVLDSGALATVSLRAAQLAGAPSLDQALGAVVAGLKQKTPRAKPLQTPFPRITLSGDQSADAPTQKAERFEALEKGRKIYLRAAAGLTHGWMISQTTSAPLDQAGDADLLSEVMLNVALIDVYYAEQKAAGATAR